MTMTAKTYDAAFFQGQFDTEAARSTSGGTKNEYLKLTGGQNDLRILPGDPLFAVIRQHGYKNSEGRFSSALDYGFILSNPAVAEAALANNYITGDDLAAAQQFGDPFSKLAEVAKSLGVDDKLITTWPRTRYLWNAVDRTKDPKVLLFESSKTFFDGVSAIFAKAPDLFDPENGRDIGIKGNGRDGIQRRYEAPIADFDTSPVGFEYEDEMIDLDAVVARKCRPWQEKARAMFSKHGDLAAQVGITPDLWGM